MSTEANRTTMGVRSKTRLSLCYLAGYLLLGGVGLVVQPRLALQLLMAEGDYGSIMPRLAGGLMLALGILVVQIIRLHLDVLYTATLVARSLLLLIIAALFASSGDPLFLVLLTIVGLGFLLTGASYLSDRRRR